MSCFAQLTRGLLMSNIDQSIGRPNMKTIKMMILLASLFAIAGAAFFQLCVLLANTLFAQQAYNRHTSRLS
jgi:hypothetical protein